MNANIIRKLQCGAPVARHSARMLAHRAAAEPTAAAAAAPPTARQSSSSPASATSAAEAEEAAQNQPLAYFGSNAASWSALASSSGLSNGKAGSQERPWYQPLVISGSLGVFLLYFCVLREESDIDGKLNANLFDHVAGLEETQLRLAYNFNKEHGIATEALEARIAEVEAQKASGEQGA